MALWLLPMQAALKPITTQEAQWANQLPRKRSQQFTHSRGCVRDALSTLWGIAPLDIPLQAPPGEPPVLANGWGHVSFSHCSDALFIGWSPKRIGVDIEKADRFFKADQLLQRYFSTKDKIALQMLNEEKRRPAILQEWVTKEAAIKWQRGALMKDFQEWSFCKNSKKAIHQTLGYQITVQNLHHKSWFIAIAFDRSIHKHQHIICHG